VYANAFNAPTDAAHTYLISPLVKVSATALRTPIWYAPFAKPPD